MKKLISVLRFGAFVACFLAVSTVTSFAQTSDELPTAVYEGQVPLAKTVYCKDYVDYIKPIPRIFNVAAEDLEFETEPNLPPPTGSMSLDVAFDLRSSPVSFPVGVAGIPNTGSAPPDPTCGASASYCVVAVNSSFAIYDRNGVNLGTFNINSFTGDTRSIFDPRVVWDGWTGRFIMIWDVRSGSASEVKVMMSTSSNPLTGWHIYNLPVRHVDVANNLDHWMDYPRLGVNRDAAVVSGIYFPNSGSFAQVNFEKVFFIGKGPMTSGSTISFWSFKDFTSNSSPDYAIAAANMKSQPVNANGQDEMYMASSKLGGSNNLTFWRFSTLDSGLPTLLSSNLIPVSTYAGGPSMGQSGTGADLIAGDLRLLCLEYLNGSLLTCHNVLAPGSSQAGIKIYKFTNAATPTATLDEVFWGGGDTDYAFGCVTGNALRQFLCFSRGGDSELTTMRVVGRDPTSTSWTGSIGVAASTASYNITPSNRWGDYFGAATDPADDLSFWAFGEYATGATTWNTWVSRSVFKPFANVVTSSLSGQLKTTVTFTATVTASNTGAPLSGKSVNFLVGGTLVGTAVTNASGVATLAYLIPFQTPGNVELKAQTIEDSSYAANFDTKTLTVQKHTPVINVFDNAFVYSANGILFGYLDEQDFSHVVGRTLSFTVNGVNVGTQTTDVGGNALLSFTNNLNAGVYALGVSFAGDTWYNAVSYTAGQFTSQLCPTSITVHSSAGTVGLAHTLTGSIGRNTDNAGISVPITVMVAGVTVGTPTSASGNISLNWTVTSGTLGSNTLTMDFAGNSQYAASSGSSTFVRNANTTISVNSLTSSRLETRTLTATLSMAPSGTPIASQTLSFSVNSVAVGSAVTAANGVASLSTMVSPSLPVGNVPINVAFAGSGNLLASSGVGTLTVTKYVTTLTANSATGTTGQVIPLSSTLRRTLDATGVNGASIAYQINFIGVGSAVTNASGVATLNWTVTGGPLGPVQLRADFAGNADYLSSLSTSTFTRVGKTLSGTVALQNYVGPVSGLPVAIEVRTTGGSLVFNQTVPLDGTSRWTMNNVDLATGTYVFNAKVTHWLARNANVTVGTTGNTAISHSLINGDVDQDNEVGPGDFSQLSIAFGSAPGDGNWNPMADLDGDEEVGPGDFAILSTNFGQSGD